MLLSKKKSLVLSEYYYERSTALSLCVCVSVCVSFRRGGASVDDFDTMKAFSSFKGAEKNGLFRVSFSTLFLSCVTLNKVLSFFLEKTFASLLFSSLLCVPRGGGGVVVAVVVRSLTEEKEDDTIYQRRR